MIEWYKCTEKIPEKESKLIVKCGEKLFFGISTSWEFRYTNEDEFLFKMTYFAQSIPERETFVKVNGGKWIYPTYFKEPECWAYINMPNEE